MAPRAVLMKTGLKSFNTARPVNTVRSVNTGRPFSTVSGCIKHMTGNIAQLSDLPKTLMEVTYLFGGGEPIGGRITGKGKKGIKREYSIARTPQQNGVAERKNRTLIEAARTILADSNNTYHNFGQEALSNCLHMYRIGSLISMPITRLLNELLLEVFDGKSDEGFFVGYSLSSKAFRVYNTRTRKVQENLHVRFLENKPMLEGNGIQGVSKSSTSSQQDQDNQDLAKCREDTLDLHTCLFGLVPLSRKNQKEFLKALSDQPWGRRSNAGRNFYNSKLQKSGFLVIYLKVIEQLWYKVVYRNKKEERLKEERTAEASTDTDGEVTITAIIDGQSKTITEASLRRHLKLEDHDVSTAPINISTARETRSTAGRVVYGRRSKEARKDKRKSNQWNETKPLRKKVPRTIGTKRDWGLEEAIRLQEQVDEEERAQIARDEEIARQLLALDEERATSEPKTTKDIDLEINHQFKSIGL
ncbi:retrovirus-related pol polyprotein from transposon TNT 1-94 [Tanacetum coccineum]